MGKRLNCLEPGIIKGADLPQLLLDVFSYIERLDKITDGLLRDFYIGAGEALECFIRFWVALPAQNGLNGLSHHDPVVFQVPKYSELF